MAKQQTDTQNTNDEFSRIFDEYRAKIEEITRKAERNLQNTNAALNNQIDHTVDDINKPEEVTPEEVIPEEISPEEQPKPKSKIISIEEPSDKEAAEIIKEAKNRAKEIIRQAEENCHKEARKKTQAQVDKIISRAEKDSEDITTRARQTAEKEINNLVESAKQEAEQIVKEIAEQYQNETRAQSSQITIEAREKAEKMIGDVVTSSTEISKLITEIVDRAKDTINDFESKMQAEIGELTAAITEAHIKLEQATAAMIIKKEIPGMPSGKNRDIKKNTVLFVRFMGEKSNRFDENNPLFSGQVEMRSVSAFDYRELKKLIDNLVRIPGVKYIQEYASEKEMAVILDIKEPLPLLDIVSNNPMVDEVITGADGISLVLKASG